MSEERAPRLFSTYVVLVVAAGLGTLALAGANAARHGLVGDHPVGFGLLAALLLLSEAKPMTFLRRHEGTDITISWTFAFALLLLSPAGGLVAMWLASTIGDVLRRTSLVRIVFNAAQLTLSLAAALLILHGSHGDGTTGSTGPSLVWLVAMLAAAATVFL